MPDAPRLRRVMGYRDVVFFLVTASVNLQWVATAAGAGPKAIALWLLGFAMMMVPLALAVIELSSRYPQEGGIYLWTKKAFGDFGGFMTRWCFWVASLPYFPGVLFFGIGNALFIGGDDWLRLSDNKTFMTLTAIALLGVATFMNVVGMNVGKWLNNAGAMARWLAVLILAAIGLAAWSTFGSATEFTLDTMVSVSSIKDLIFWSAITFALTGIEAVSFMGDEIKEPRRTVPRAILAAAPLACLVYLVATISVQVAMPASEVGRFQGILQAISFAMQRLGLGWLAPIAAFLVALSALGSVGLWLGAVAHVPFVAGIDRFLPRWFARVHPRWRTPHYSLLLLAGIEVLCIYFAQYGTTVAGAYDYLVSMSIIGYMIPYVLVFAALIRLQREPAGPEVRRVPGGAPAAILMGALGLLTVSVAFVLAFVPPDGEPDPQLWLSKLVLSTLVMILGGVVLYAVGRRRIGSGRPDPRA